MHLDGEGCGLLRGDRGVVEGSHVGYMDNGAVRSHVSNGERGGCIPHPKALDLGRWKAEDHAIVGSEIAAKHETHAPLFRCVSHFQAQHHVADLDIVLAQALGAVGLCVGQKRVDSTGLAPL